jgi:hypothetical protein
MPLGSPLEDSILLAMWWFSHPWLGRLMQVKTTASLLGLLCGLGRVP